VASEILAGLEGAGYLKDGKPLELDILKIPHHGSAASSNPDFYKAVRAKHYVFCGTGDFNGHRLPDKGVFEWIRDERGKDNCFVHLTFDEKRKEILKLQAGFKNPWQFPKKAADPAVSIQI
jgi:hypothetical protein